MKVNDKGKYGIILLKVIKYGLKMYIDNDQV